MDTNSNFTGDFLIAMPGMSDPNFAQSVALVCEHNSDGALGLIINQPSQFTLGEVLDQMDITCEHENARSQAVLQGGPMQTERGFVLHSGGPDWDASRAIDDHWAVTTSRDILTAIARGDGPQQSVVALGYAGWEANQLDQEIRDNAWLTTRANAGVVFDTTPEQRWHAAASLMGMDPAQLAAYAGHA